MSLAAGPVAGVAFVPMRFILDMEALGRESVAQLFRDQIACGSMESGNRFSDKTMLRTRRRGQSQRKRTFAACQVLKVPCRHPHNRTNE